MQLFINRDNSASDVCFVVYDELGRQKYYACLKKSKHKVKKSNIKIDITDTDKNIAAKIRQLTAVGVNSFSLKVGNSVARLAMIKTQSGIQSRFYGNNWHISGDIISKNFSIIDVDNAVISSQKKQLKGYELNINNSENELICLCVSICVNMINTVDKLVIQAV